jgi:hypothetical protein
MGVLIVLSRVVTILTIAMLMVPLAAGSSDAKLFPNGLFPSEPSLADTGSDLALGLGGFGLGVPGLGLIGGLIYDIGYLFGYGAGQGLVAGMSNSALGATLPRQNPGAPI